MRNFRGPRALIAGAAAVLLGAVVVAATLLGSSATATPSPAVTPSGQVGVSWATATAVSTESAATEPGASESAVVSPTTDATDAATIAPTATPPPATPRPPTPKPATPAPPAPPAPTLVPIATAAAPCYVLPSSNVWNRDISGLAVQSNSADMVSAIGTSAYLHPDFDAIGDGIPYNIVTSSTPTYTVSFQYADESDPGPYPIPANPLIEGGSDRHMLLLDIGRCKLWELYDAQKAGSGWTAGSGAFFDLHSNALRPLGWTSADAAGLPILPGLVRYEEVASGSITHAIRFTAPNTCGYIYPATHLTAAPCSNLPPMGLRLRLKASVDISGFGPHAQVVLTALKHYGMILADNGSPWYISGVPDRRWDDNEFHKLQQLTGADFEVVDTSSLRNG
jgi:hypothetical protein